MRVRMKKLTLGNFVLAVLFSLAALSVYSMWSIPAIESSRKLVARKNFRNVQKVTFSHPNEQPPGSGLKQIGEKNFDYNRKERLYNLRKKCQQADEAKLVKKDIPAKKLGHIIVNDQYKVLYCYIPKVACTNMKRVFLILTGKMNSTNPLALKSKDVHMAFDKYLTYLDSYSEEEVQEKLKTYKKLVFVREPLERLLSAYRNKFTEKSPYFHKRFGRRIIRRFREGSNKTKEILGNDVTFLEFVKYITDDDTIEREGFNEHWAQYVSLCQPCYVQYDFIGKYETIDEDVNFVLKDLKIDQLIKFPKRNATYKRSKTQDQLESYYKTIPKDLLQRLWKIYHTDYSLFDYPYPGVLEKFLAPQEEV
ncbi:carbohydrate sulfotransferase 11-like [Saccostrea cucullata]|uniref:carbohydrate sulfotransferase 11-like n=1 Tax=Saccostrea cuccullata TaxID=36930 RepID=UPI002ED3BDB5